MSHVATITIDHTKVAADLTDFPVLVIANGDAGWAELYNVAAEAGGDIRVFKSDGVTELPREIVSFSVSAETGEIHIKYTGTLSSTVDTDIQIHADGVSGDYAVSATYGRNAVWNDFIFVSHDGGGTDSTGNITPTGFGSVSAGNVAGKVGVATSYNGTTQYYSLGNNSILRPSNITLSTWVYQNSWEPTGYSGLIVQSISSSPYGGYSLSTGPTSDKSIGFTANFSGSWNGVSASRTDAFNGTWKHLVGTSSGTTRYIYENGSVAASGVISGSIVYASSTANTFINRNEGSGNAIISGNLDEIRITSSSRSTSWVNTEYNNQSAPSTFYSVASESGSTPQTVTATGRVSAILALLKRYKQTQTASGRASATVATKKSLKRTLTASIRGSAVVQKASVTFITVTAAIRAASTIADKSINAVAANANARVQATLRRLVRKNFTATGRVSATVVARKTRYVTLSASIRGASTVTNAKRFYETVTAIVRGATTVSRGDIFRNIILTATIGATARLGEYFYKRKYQEEEEEDYKRKFIP